MSRTSFGMNWIFASKWRVIVHRRGKKSQVLCKHHAVLLIFSILLITRKSPRANKIIQHYVLPDYSTQQRGYVKGQSKSTQARKKGKGVKADENDLEDEQEENQGDDDNDIEEDDVSSESDSDSDIEMDPADDEEQILPMNNERFTVPEILFNPSDIGMDQAGIPEAIVDAISACDEGKSMSYFFTFLHHFILCPIDI